jgi:hypothetical protein
LWLKVLNPSISMSFHRPKPGLVKSSKVFILLFLLQWNKSGKALIPIRWDF